MIVYLVIEMNEYSEAAKKILPKLIQKGIINETEASEIIDYIVFLEQQELNAFLNGGKNNKPFTKS